MAILSIPDSMLACQVIEFNKPYKIHNVPVPRNLAPTDILVKIAVASLCHTDNMVAAGTMGTPLPCTGSHEGSGTVVAIGSAVKNFVPGDRVMCGLTYHICGQCQECLGSEDYRHYCPRGVGFVGINTHGYFAEYGVADSRYSAKLPHNISFLTAAPLACAGATIFRAVKRTNLKAGEWLAIVGAGGGLGHLGIQFAKAAGLQVVAIDARDEALVVCKDFGADVVIDARKSKEDVVKKVQDVTGGNGVDATINVADHPSTAALACALTKMHGHLVQIALSEQVSIPYAELVFRDIRITGSLTCSGSEASEMLQAASDHNIRVRTNVFHGLNEVPKLVEFSHSGEMCGKGIVVVDKDQLDKEKALG